MDKSPGDIPIYKDENVSVFALPVYPEVRSLDVASGPSNLFHHDIDSSTCKRKRTPSPTPPSKRRPGSLYHSSIFIPLIFAGTSARDPASSLQEVMSHPDFDPTSLVGDAAQEWLRHVVRTMFPGSATQSQSPQVAGVSHQQCKSKVVSQGSQDPKVPSDASGHHQSTILSPRQSGTSDSAALSHKAAYVSQPTSLNRPLPSLATCKQRATLAYAVVGPRVRGKFDVKRAESLGLKAGPLRARVARGETVTVVGNDGLERNVGPSDVVGDSEDPGVCSFLCLPFCFGLGNK